MSYGIYISGPIMAPNPARPDGLVTEELLGKRKRRFGEVATIIRRQVGSTTTVINPIDVPACADATLGQPVCEGFASGKHSWQCYLRYDLREVLMCNEVVMLPGWEGSPGANVEKSVAEMIGLKISYWCDGCEEAHPQPAGQMPIKDDKECEGV